MVYILGDVVWGGDFSVLNKLNGQKIVIKGNHDKQHDLKNAVINNYICSWYVQKNLTVGQDFIYLQHFPCSSWERSSHNSYHAYGHQHGTGSFSVGRSMDVSVDCINFTPVHVEEFIIKLQDRNNFNLYYKSGEVKDLRSAK